MVIKNHTTLMLRFTVKRKDGSEHTSNILPAGDVVIGDNDTVSKVTIEEIPDAS